MSYKTKDPRTGENVTRVRPQVSFTTEPSIVEQLDVWAEKLDWKRSVVIERCICYGMERFRKEYVDKESEQLKQDSIMGKKELTFEEARKSAGEITAEKFMRKKLFDMNTPSWEQYV